METFNRKKIAFIAFITLFSIIVLSVFMLITFRGVNLSIAIDEIRYIRLDSKRQTSTYTLYKEASDFQVELDLIFAKTDFTNRATEASKLEAKGYKIAEQLNTVISEYDIKMLELNVNEKLTDNAKEYYELDSYILAELKNGLEYLQADIAITRLLITKKAIIDCYSSISANNDFEATIALYNSCYSKNSTLEIPMIESFPETVRYQNYLNSWLEKNILLYKALQQNRADEAEQLNRTSKSMIAELEKLNKLSNEELSTFLANEYYRLLRE